MNTDWPKVPLGDIAKDLTVSRTFEVTPEQEILDPTIKSATHTISVGGRNVGAGVRVTKRVRIKSGDLVFSRLHTQNGAFAFADQEFQATGTFVPLSIAEDKVDRRFLFWALHVRVPFLSASDTVGRETYKTNELLALEVPLPPLAEQRRIVARIDALAAKIEEAHCFRQSSVNEAQALLMSQVRCIFDELAKHRPTREFRSFNPHVTSGPRNWAKHYQEGGQRFYRAQDIGSNGTVLPESKVFIEPPLGAQGRSASLQPGDLMLVITGATVGRCAVFRKELEPGFVSQHVGICRLPKESVDPDFALWGLRGPKGQEQLLGQRYGQGKPGLNLSNIDVLALPVPSLPEQRRIVDYLNGLQAKVDALKKLQAETAANLDALLPSILDKAFKGEF